MIAKLVAGREKDLLFAEALLRARIVEPGVLRERVGMLDDAHPVAVRRIIGWLDGVGSG